MDTRRSQLLSFASALLIALGLTACGGAESGMDPAAGSDSAALTSDGPFASVDELWNRTGIGAGARVLGG